MWGATIEQVRAARITLSPNDEVKTFGQMFIATNLPKTIADAQLVGLFFTRSNHLWRIAIILNSTDNDPYGSTSRSRYANLKSTLTARYGAGREVAYTDHYYGGDDWVMGLRMGKNFLGTMFETPELSVSLSINATDTNTSNCTIFYESKSWRDVFSREKSAGERDAL